MDHILDNRKGRRRQKRQNRQRVQIRAAQRGCKRALWRGNRDAKQDERQEETSQLIASLQEVKRIAAEQYKAGSGGKASKGRQAGACAFSLLVYALVPTKFLLHTPKALLSTCGAGACANSSKAACVKLLLVAMLVLA